MINVSDESRFCPILPNRKSENSCDIFLMESIALLLACQEDQNVAKALEIVYHALFGASYSLQRVCELYIKKFEKEGPFPSSKEFGFDFWGGVKKLYQILQMIDEVKKERYKDVFLPHELKRAVKDADSKFLKIYFYPSFNSESMSEKE